MQYTGKRQPEPKHGRRALIGQFTREIESPRGGVSKLDLSERINFERSKYIPGNGAEHRLGRRS